MRHLDTRARKTGFMSLCLLLLSTLGAGGVVAAPAVPAPPVHTAAALVSGNNSCNGTNACTNAVGPIGDNSCNGDFACAGSTGSIGNYACNGLNACLLSAAGIGDYSCNWELACDNAQASIGAGSCTGFAICLSLASAVGDCANNTAGLTPAVCIQPDARIRRSAGPLLGDGPIDGSDAFVTTAGAGGVVRRLYISIQNDALLQSDSFTVDATGETTPGFGLRFFSGNSNRDITAAIEGGTFITPVLAPGAVFQIRVRVYIGTGAVTDSTINRAVKATSIGDTSKLNAVGFSVRKR